MGLPPAPGPRSSARKSAGLRSPWSRVQIPPGAPLESYISTKNFPSSVLTKAKVIDDIKKGAFGDPLRASTACGRVENKKGAERAANATEESKVPASVYIIINDTRAPKEAMYKLKLSKYTR